MNPRTTRMDEFRRARDEVQRMNSADRQRADTRALANPVETPALDTDGVS